MSEQQERPNFIELNADTMEETPSQVDDERLVQNLLIQDLMEQTFDPIIWNEILRRSYRNGSKEFYYRALRVAAKSIAAGNLNATRSPFAILTTEEFIEFMKSHSDYVMMVCPNGQLPKPVYLSLMKTKEGRDVLEACLGSDIEETVKERKVRHIWWEDGRVNIKYLSKHYLTLLRVRFRSQDRRGFSKEQFVEAIKNLFDGNEEIAHFVYRGISEEWLSVPENNFDEFKICFYGIEGLAVANQEETQRLLRDFYYMFDVWSDLIVNPDCLVSMIEVQGLNGSFIKQMDLRPYHGSCGFCGDLSPVAEMLDVDLEGSRLEQLKEGLKVAFRNGRLSYRDFPYPADRYDNPIVHRYQPDELLDAIIKEVGAENIREIDFAGWPEPDDLRLKLPNLERVVST